MEPILFENQNVWEDFASSVYSEFGLNTLTTSSSAMQIPEVGPNEGVKHALTYRPLSQESSLVVLDVLLDEVALAEGETRIFDAVTLEAAVRKAVTRYQVHARSMDCHIAGKFLAEDNAVVGALLRVYRNADFPCTGHPEMLINTALGMFHCDKCNDLQVAGSFHLPKETADAE